MNILVTGGAGYIGSHTVQYLIRHGYKTNEVIVFDNLVYGHKDSLPKGVKLIIGDLLNKDEIDRVFKENKIDAVIHFAAYAYIGESMTNPGKYFENNISGGLNLLECMLRYHCNKIVFSSTCATYGYPKKIPITEKSPQKPINPYGESKLVFEKILEWNWNIHGIRSVRLRYFNAAGAAYGIGEQHNPETHLIPSVIKGVIRGNPVNIYGTDYQTPDGTCVRDYVHVLDLAEAHALSLAFLENHDVSLKLNLGTGIGTSVKQIIDLVENVSGKRPIINYSERRPGDPDSLVSDPTNAYKVLKWLAKNDIKKIIKDAFEWHNSSNALAEV